MAAGRDGAAASAWDATDAAAGPACEPRRRRTLRRRSDGVCLQVAAGGRRRPGGGGGGSSGGDVGGEVALVEGVGHIAQAGRERLDSELAGCRHVRFSRAAAAAAAAGFF
jgi:hypothetical protein